VYLGALLSIPIFALLVSGFAPLRSDNTPAILIPENIIEDLEHSESPVLQVAAEFAKEISKPAGIILFLAGIGALVYLGYKTFQLDKSPRERMYVVLVLTFFSMLFWAFFEQAGSSLNNFTDRNVDRVFENRTLTKEDVGQTIVFRVPVKTEDAELAKLPLLSQEQLGQKYGNESLRQSIEKAIRSEEKNKNKMKPADVDKMVKAIAGEKVLTLTAITYLRDAVKDEANKDLNTVSWQVTPENEGMAVSDTENPATIFQAFNPIFILLFGIVFSALWTYLGKRGWEPNTSIKFALGLLQLGLGFGAIWMGAQQADSRGMVALNWLVLGYLLHTTGELCLSPVGLSMVTKMSPHFLVSTVMGMWFLATAFSQFLAAILAQFTKVTGAETSAVPVPSETVNVYGTVFGTIALMAMGSALVCFILAPLLTRWMHEGVTEEGKPVGEPEAGSA
jgi:POT family proton-dependent oligopeptide transporter